jgi:hypothetical protein
MGESFALCRWMITRKHALLVFALRGLCGSAPREEEMREKEGCYFVMDRRVKQSGGPDIRLTKLDKEQSVFSINISFTCIHP